MVSGVINLHARRKKRPTGQPNHYQRKVLGMAWALLDALHPKSRPIWKARLRRQDSRLDEELYVELGPDLQMRVRDGAGRIVAQSSASRRRIPSWEAQPWRKW